jgi:deoxyadenosine/deoxycytidine kinase
MIVTLEGHSYSGKTTLLNYIEANLPVQAIAEHDRYAGSIDKYPPFPAIREEMAEDSVDFFAKLEKLRYKDCLSAIERTVVYDRSFISVVLFQKYMKHLNVSGQFDAYHYAKTLFVDLLEKNRIALPDFFVYVRCSNAEIYKQRQGREISVESLRGEDAQVFFESCYGRIFNVYYQFGRALELRSDDTNDSLRENTHMLDMAIEGMNELDEANRKIITDRIVEVL